MEIKDTLQAAVKTEKLPSIHTKKGKQIATNIARRVINGEQSLDSVPKKYYSYIQGEVQGAEPVRRAREEVAQEISPVVSGLALGPAGVVAALTGEAVNMGVNATTHGEKRSWGDIFANPEKHPVWNTIWNFTNPGYFLAGGIKPSKPTNVGVRLLKGEAPEHIIETSVKEFEKGINKTKIPGEVKYYGPTMGKTTAVKTNPNLVDFDDVMRQPSKELLKKYGFNSKYEMFESGNQKAIQEYQDLLVSKMKEFKADPKNSGKTLVVSQNPVVNPEVTGFQFDNTPSIPERDVFIERNMGRGGDYVGSAGWYDNLIKSNPNLKIDNRFVSEIEGNKVINAPKQSSVSPQQAATTYHFNGRIPLSRPISETEIVGIPKGVRNSLSKDTIAFIKDALKSGDKKAIQSTARIVYRGNPKIELHATDYLGELSPDPSVTGGDLGLHTTNDKETLQSIVGKFLKDGKNPIYRRILFDNTNAKRVTDLGNWDSHVWQNAFEIGDPNVRRILKEKGISKKYLDDIEAIFEKDALTSQKYFPNYDKATTEFMKKLEGSVYKYKNKHEIGHAPSHIIVSTNDFANIVPKWELPALTIYKHGGIIKAQNGTSFEHYLSTLPENQRDSTDYNVKRYWELNGKPKDFKEAINKNMFRFDETDGYWHANSIAYNKETGEYEFMKKPNHKTLQLELDEYNRNSDFNSKYKLDTLSTPWKYVKK